MRGRKPVILVVYSRHSSMIKKESPNEGTETNDRVECTVVTSGDNKKRIPE